MQGAPAVVEVSLKIHLIGKSLDLFIFQGSALGIKDQVGMRLHGTMERALEIMEFQVEALPVYNSGLAAFKSFSFSRCLGLDLSSSLLDLIACRVAGPHNG